MRKETPTILNDFKNNKIIFFDGVCNLCNGFIDFVIKRDSKKIIYYAPLQSEISKTLLKNENIHLGENFSTIYFYDAGKFYEQSSAILMIVKNLSIGYKLAATLCFIIPKSIRNIVYNYIARNRYRFFGKKETCRLPSQEEWNQFL
jgi:predicted DCC family thiol-disulfide oxidoreductase YuxK